MVDGVCRFHYPKPFESETVYEGESIYPRYRRRSPAHGGAQHTLTAGRDRNRVIDNRWIVPHSPYLLLKYRCHLNVEICFSLKGVKYLYKYLYKGGDRAMVSLDHNGRWNEVRAYHDLRSFGSAEAIWRTFDFALYSRKPHVERLAVHLPNQQRAYWREGVRGAAAAAVDSGPATTQLTAWLDYLRNHADRHPVGVRGPGTPIDAQPMTDTSRGCRAWSGMYPDFPERYAWNSTAKVWTERVRQGDAIVRVAIGRVYHVPHGRGELFYLRLLLHRVTGDALALLDVEDAHARQRDRYTLDAFLYYDGVRHETFKACCEARGLLQDDNEWYLLLEDAAETQMPQALRRLFVYILANNEVAEPMTLFAHFVASLGDDFVHDGADDATAHACALVEIDDLLQRANASVEGFVVTAADRALAAEGMRAHAHAHEPRIVRDELPDMAHEQQEYESNVDLLLDRQRAIVNAVESAVQEGRGYCLFVDAPGGTGKTFTANVLLNAVRRRGAIALATATSGIAAILLDRGRTFHSRFRASRHPGEPVQPLPIDAQEPLADLLRRASVILWDEGAMGNRFHLEALHLTLCDLMGVDQEDHPFGGKVIVVLGGAIPRPRTFQAHAVTATHAQWQTAPS